ncbi:MAG: adenine phosphoribosyltransferase [Proteobacteria bacterium]|nr:adenine phosphoribosyltransferase [Pseudomonadota bacterium]
MTHNADLIRSLVRDVPDFPKPGIIFKDITPILANPQGLTAAIDALCAPFMQRGITRVAGMEARGFIFGVPVAERLGAGFVPIRKPGKLPAATHHYEYELEYGTDALEIHRDAAGPNDKVLIVDDLLATGGTAAAAIQLVQQTGAQVMGLSFLIELDFLQGRNKLEGFSISSLIHY